MTPTDYVRTLYNSNTAPNFWCLTTDPGLTSTDWTNAIKRASVVLPESAHMDGITLENLLFQTLGEGQFGDKHWKLSRSKQIYYQLKPIIPRRFIRILRKIYQTPMQSASLLRWPVEDRYVCFQREIIRNLLESTNRDVLTFTHFWPQGYRFALVLTHDIETREGQANARKVADLEEKLGFRSSFNFIPERYPLDYKLMEELRFRGFEIGVHGLKHDGKLFRSHSEFATRVKRINFYLKEFGSVGFRAPLTHRHPEWMQELNIEYDLSFFDTDPFEPIPGGTMSIWPFKLGKFIELPYTLVQDYSLVSILGERTADIWLQKLQFIKAHCGMALLNTHPDYLMENEVWNVYFNFLHELKQMKDYWHALPHNVASWWKARSEVERFDALPNAVMGDVRLFENKLLIEPQASNLLAY